MTPTEERARVSRAATDAAHRCSRRAGAGENTPRHTAESAGGRGGPTGERGSARRRNAAAAHDSWLGNAHACFMRGGWGRAKLDHHQLAETVRRSGYGALGGRDVDALGTTRRGGRIRRSRSRVTTRLRPRAKPTGPTTGASDLCLRLRLRRGKTLVKRQADGGAARACDHARARSPGRAIAPGASPTTTEIGPSARTASETQPDSRRPSAGAGRWPNHEVATRSSWCSASCSTPMRWVQSRTTLRSVSQ